MARQDHCPRCGTELDAASLPEGLCPACLMQQALEEFPSTDGEGGEPQATATADSFDAASPSRTIGPYRLLQKLGEGGMGEVWAAEQQAPVRRKVALKLIKRGMDTKQVVARFESERQALALMDHPNGISLLQIGDVERARPHYRRVLELNARIELIGWLEDSVLLANLVRDAGEHADAERLYEDVINRAERQEGTQLKPALLGYAELLRRMRRDEDAAEQEARAAELEGQSGPPVGRDEGV